MEKTPWSVPVAVEDIPETGLHMEIEAPASVREDVAAFACIRDLPQLSAVFDLVRQGAGVHVSGRLSARVGQTCVVSLEPIESELAEDIDATFGPASAAKSGDEPPEPLAGGSIDLGALATEFLILAIDPYPRKAGARFVPPPAEDAGERPFAALETLKKSLGGGKP